MTNYIVAFVGLPSAGKSSLINSLVGKRILQTGMCRTTTDYKLLEEEVIDDDKNKFKIIDLPGICDGEEIDNKFTELTYAHITNANLIFWVSDVNKAFITQHEVNEFNKLKQHINTLQDETGTLYEIGIILSKCTERYLDHNLLKKKNKTNNKTSNIILNGEIITEDEDTNINDIVNKVKEKFPTTIIKLYNAHGRSLYSKHSSTQLKKLITNLKTTISNENINFTISEYYKNKDQKQSMIEDLYIERLFEKYIKTNNITDFNKVINKFKILDVKKQKIYINKFCVNNFKTITYTQFEFHEYIIQNHNNLYDKYHNYMWWLIYIIYNESYNNVNVNKYYKNLNEIINKLNIILPKLTDTEYIYWYDVVCNFEYFDSKQKFEEFYFDSKQNYIKGNTACELLTKSFNIKNEIINNHLKYKLNELLLTHNSTIINRYCDIIYIKMYNNKNSFLNNIELNTCEDIEQCLDVIDKFMNNLEFIIYNKLIAYKNIRNIISLKYKLWIHEIIDDYKANINKNYLYELLLNTTRFNNIIKQVMNQIYTPYIDQINKTVPYFIFELIFFDNIENIFNNGIIAEETKKYISFLAIKKDINYILYIPNKYKTKELCEIVLNNSKSFHIISIIPDEFKTYELYKEAVKEDINNIKIIPNKFKTKELYEIIINNYTIQDIMNYIPDEFKTYEIWINIVKKDFNCITNVPDKFKTKELCEIVLSQNMENDIFEHIPDEFKTYEICKNAIKHDCENIRYIPNIYKNNEIIDILINNIEKYSSTYTILDHIPEELITDDIIIKTIHNSIYNIKYIPEKNITNDLILRIINKYNIMSDDDCDQFNDEFYNFCIILIEHDIHNIIYIPNEFKDDKLYKLLCDKIINEYKINKDIPILKYIPDEFKTNILCDIIYNKDNTQIEYIPDKYKPIKVNKFKKIKIN